MIIPCVGIAVKIVPLDEGLEDINHMLQELRECDDPEHDHTEMIEKLEDLKRHLLRHIRTHCH